MIYALAPTLVTDPAALPVTLAEVKAALRVDHYEEDDLIDGMIGAAVGHLDGWYGILGRCLITQTWRQDFAEFPASDEIRLPFPDVESVTVKYLDRYGVEQTLAAEKYELIETVSGVQVVLAYNEQWPNTGEYQDAVRITFTCGFGASGAAVPAPLRTAIMMHVASLYEMRETASEKPFTSTGVYEALTAKYRRVL